MVFFRIKALILRYITLNGTIMRKIIMAMALLMGVATLQAQSVKDVENRANFAGLAFVAPEPAIMIGTYDAKGTPDVMMAAWGGQSDGDKIKIHLSEHKTTDNLRLKKAFTVSFATVRTMAESDYLGTVSGKDVPDKLKKVGFTSHKSPNVDAPIIDQYPVALECEVVSFENGVLIGKVINASADKGVLDAEGNIDMGKMQVICFDPVSSSYRVVGDIVGKAWGAGEKFK